MGFLDFFSITIGVDLGSQYLRIANSKKLVFNELSQVTLNKSSGKFSGFGNLISLGKDDAIITPIDCVIADFFALEMLLRNSLNKAHDIRSIISSSYISYVGIPTCATECDKRAYRDALEHAGSKEIYLIDQCFCAAISMKILFEQKHFILIDFGSSKIEMTVIVNSIIIAYGATRMGTTKIFKLIKNFLRRKYKIKVTDQEVEEIIVDLNQSYAEIKIQHVLVNVSEIHELINNFFSIVNDEFLEVLERAENHNDFEKAVNNGIYFTGGGSTIEFLREKILTSQKIKRTISKSPLLDNITGLQEIMADKKKFKNYLMN